MGRPPLVHTAQVLEAARDVAWDRGCAGVAVTEVAARLGRPSGSLYHRYAGRDDLLADVWLEAVEHFQAGYLAAAADDDPAVGARAAALHVVRWSRDEPRRANVLLWFRRTDLLGGEWPASVVARATAAGERLEEALADLAARLGCSPRRLTLCVVDVPYAVARRRLRDGGATAEEEALVTEVVEALLSGRDRPER